MFYEFKLFERDKGIDKVLIKIKIMFATTRLYKNG